jgi:selenocysteine-specific elongation factor
MGCAAPAEPLVGDWLVDPQHAADLAVRLRAVIAGHAAMRPLEPGMTLDAVRRALGLPDRRLVEALVRPPLQMVDGRVKDSRQAGGLPPAVAAAVAQLRTELSAHPFRAPEHEQLAALGLDRRGLAAAAREGALLRVADGIVLLPDADRHAARILAGLPQPFTTAAAREALDTTRRVAIPLLEYLDRCGATERVDEHHRRCRSAD